MSNNNSQSVSAGRDATGIVQQTGGGNRAEVKVTQTTVTLPPADTVDIGREIAALRRLLEQIGGEDRSKVSNALADAEAELDKPDPDKDEIADALDRALKYAEKSGQFADAVAKLESHVTRAAAWVGAAAPKLLGYLGLSA